MRASCISVVAFALVLIAAASDADAQSVGAYPEQLVKSDGSRVSNGCGPESWMVNREKRFWDSHRFDWGSYNDYRWYSVNFRESCNLHDVGYQGTFFVESGGQWTKQPLVYDRIRREYVDYKIATRDWVDRRFLLDMQTQCEQQIRAQPNPEDHDRAIGLCFARAETYFRLVQEWGRGGYEPRATD
jgi:hypothetical protein